MKNTPALFSELLRFDPLRRFENVQRFLVPPMDEIKMDVKDTPDAYEVTVDTPGIDKENAHVFIDGSRVRIELRRESKKEESAEDGRWIHVERSSSSTSREFSLAVEIDRDNASAKMENGVLYLTLPKRKKESNGRLEITG